LRMMWAAFTRSVKIAAVPVLPAGRRSAKSGIVELDAREKRRGFDALRFERQDRRSAPGPVRNRLQHGLHLAGKYLAGKIFEGNLDGLSRRDNSAQSIWASSRRSGCRRSMNPSPAPSGRWRPRALAPMRRCVRRSQILVAPKCRQRSGHQPPLSVPTCAISRLMRIKRSLRLNGGRMMAVGGFRRGSKDGSLKPLGSPTRIFFRSGNE